MKICVDEACSSLTLLSSEFELVQNDCSNGVGAVIMQNNNVYADVITNAIARQIPIMGSSRLNKIQQYVLANNFNITMPKTYYNKNKLLPFQTLGEFDANVNLKEFVIKPIAGARGAGVALINRQKYYDIIHSTRKEQVANILSGKIDALKEEITGEEYMKSKYEYDDVDIDSYVFQAVRNSEMIIQEPIEVKNEYRFILTKNKAIGYKRIRTEGSFTSNLSAGGSVDVVEIDLLVRANATIFGKIRKLMKAMKYPWLSVDIYEDVDGFLGCFEYQMEFAWEHMDGPELSKMLCEAVSNMIVEIRKDNDNAK